MLVSGFKMENGSRKIGWRMVLGVLVALTIIGAILISGIQLPGFQDKTGKLSIYLKDAPVEVNALWINMTELEVHKADGEGEWITINITDTFEEGEDWLEFDLLKYQNETVLELANASVITGTYDKLRLTVTGAEAWYWNETATINEETGYPVDEENITTQPLRVPPSRIDVIIDFTIDTNAAVVITIDMQPNWIAISTTSDLRPVLKATVGYDEVEK
jgi:hypothetical protein